MVVGDDDQSIYRFRGADIANILEFKRRYPGSQQLSLTRNNRSTQSILDHAHQLIENNNPDRLEAIYKISKRLIGLKKGQSPVVRSFLGWDEEAHWIASDIKRRLKSGEEPSEIAVLLRRNQDARRLERYLQLEGVPYQIVGETQNLYQHPAVRILLNFLNWLTDPNDNTSLYHLLTSPLYGFDPADLRMFSSIAKRQHRHLEAVLLEEGDSRAKTVIKDLQAWRSQLHQLSVTRLCYELLKHTKYLKRLISSAAERPEVDTDIAALHQFFSSLADYEHIAADITAVGFVDSLPALIGSGERVQNEDLPDIHGVKVSLLSVHRAKGLEFNSVYIYNLVQNTFPSIRRGESLAAPAELFAESPQATAKAHLQEERRLMYVAMTRARQNLTLTYSLDHGGKLPAKPSIFITEAMGRLELTQGLTSLAQKAAQIELFGQAPKTAIAPDLPFVQGDWLVLNSSQIEVYLRCPAEFKLRYVIAPPQMPTFSLDYGSLMHAAFQQYNQGIIDGNTVPLQALKQRIKGLWPQEGFISKQHSERALKQAISTLERFYKREQRAASHPRYIERSFEVKVPDIKLRLVGRFDAVYEQAEEVEIRDYKTGASTVTDQERADRRTARSLQLGIYAWAWQHLSGNAPRLVSLDFVDAGFIGTATKTARQLETVEAKIKEANAGIRAGDFTPANSHQFCTHQEYGF